MRQYEHFAERIDWSRVEGVEHIARTLHETPGWDADQLPWPFCAQRADYQSDPDVFGQFVGLKPHGGDIEWWIGVNQHLPLAWQRFTVGHETGHYFEVQDLRAAGASLPLAHCKPGHTFGALEVEAHLHSAVLTVPADRIQGLDLSFRGIAETARQAIVPEPAVMLRIVADYKLGRRAGSTDAEISDRLDYALHCLRAAMVRTADYTRARLST